MFITLATAKTHLRIDGADSDADLTQKIGAAEREAIEHLQRNVYLDQTALDAAIALVPAQLVAAKSAYDIADAAALAMTDADLSLIERNYCRAKYMHAQFDAQRTRNGLVINDSVLAAMLLILGDLFETREDAAGLPQRARDMLSLFRSYE